MHWKIVFPPSTLFVSWGGLLIDNCWSRPEKQEALNTDHASAKKPRRTRRAVQLTPCWKEDHHRNMYSTNDRSSCLVQPSRHYGPQAASCFDCCGGSTEIVPGQSRLTHSTVCVAKKYYYFIYYCIWIVCIIIIIIIIIIISLCTTEPLAMEHVTHVFIIQCSVNDTSTS